MAVPTGLLQRLAQYAGKNKDIVGNVATGSALTAGFGLLAGGPKAAAAYGAADFLAAYPATLLARKLGSKITKPVMGIDPKTVRGGLETVANLGASIVSPVVVDAVAGKALYPETAQGNVPQQQQIAQEMEQRAAINNLQTPQLVSPGTQFQMQGLEQTFLQNFTKPQSYMAEMMPEYESYLADLRSYGRVQ
jgi:putative intracellular protease/amidase